MWQDAKERFFILQERKGSMKETVALVLKLEEAERVKERKYRASASASASAKSKEERTENQAQEQGKFRSHCCYKRSIHFWGKRGLAIVRGVNPPDSLLYHRGQAVASPPAHGPSGQHNTEE